MNCRCTKLEDCVPSTIAVFRNGKYKPPLEAETKLGIGLFRGKELLKGFRIPGGPVPVAGSCQRRVGVGVGLWKPGPEGCPNGWLRAAWWQGPGEAPVRTPPPLMPPSRKASTDQTRAPGWLPVPWDRRPGTDRTEVRLGEEDVLYGDGDDDLAGWGAAVRSRDPGRPRGRYFGVRGLRRRVGTVLALSARAPPGL